MTIRQTHVFTNQVFLCIHYNFDKYRKSNSMILGYKYSIHLNGTYLMSIKDKYNGPFNQIINNKQLLEIILQKHLTIEKFLESELNSWWKKTTLFNLDYAKSEINESFNSKFYEFLAWSDIIPDQKTNKTSVDSEDLF